METEVTVPAASKPTVTVPCTWVDATGAACIVIVSTSDIGS
jgi:hypothetical protein